MFSPQAYEQQLKDEFDQERAKQRRMMVVSLHDRLGHASRVGVLDRFIAYSKGHKDVWFARTDEIAKHALETPDITPKVIRDVADVSGSAGTSRK